MAASDARYLVLNCNIKTTAIVTIATLQNVDMVTEIVSLDLGLIPTPHED